MRNIFQSHYGMDWFMHGAVMVLLFFSLAQLYSLGQHSGIEGRFFKQFMFVLVGLGVLFFFSYIHYLWWKNWSVVLYIVGVVLLALVLLVGQDVRGSRGWFILGGVNFQPVELMQALFVIFMAHFFSSQPRDRHYGVTLLLSLVYLIVPLVLVLLQPDFGSGMVLVGIWLGFVVFSPRLSKKSIVALLGVVLIVGVVGWAFLLAPYQKDRVHTFFNPSRDPLGRGYNVRQSIIAIGSGKIWGRGLGLGPQSQLNFLPEKSTDFIFASLGEELGFLGASLVLILFLIIFIRVYIISQRSTDDYTYLLACGIMSLFAIKFTVNIGMNLGLLPVTGLPLPFLSYGGSAFISSMMLIGVAQSMARQQNLF